MKPKLYFITLVIFPSIDSLWMGLVALVFIARRNAIYCDMIQVLFLNRVA